MKNRIESAHPKQKQRKKKPKQKRRRIQRIIEGNKISDRA
jgi:hypothetical protein